MRVTIPAILGAAVVGLLFSGPAAAAPECEIDRPVVFAGLDWDSNRFHTAVARHIVEAGYGCETDELPGSTLPLLTGMARGDIDVTMEIWKNNVEEAWNKFESRGDVAEVGVNYPDGVQGWFVPTFVIEGDSERGIEAMAPDMRHVEDMARYKELFTDPEEPSKGRFYNCILGWGCEVINTKKLEAYGLDEHYTNFRPGTGAALSAAIASAHERGKPVFAYYWGPTWLLGKYDMTLIEEPEYSDACWQNIKEMEHPEQGCAYPIIEVTVAVNTDFREAAPTLTEFLARYTTSNELVSKALAYMEENDATAQEAAMNFLRTRQDVWTEWVPQEVADRVLESVG